MDSQPTANFVAGQLVACGGGSCDRYEDGSWRHMVYTISRRRQHSSAQSENRILLIGGFDDSSRSTTEWISLKVGVFVMTFLNIDNMIECWSARNLRNRFTMVTESKKRDLAEHEVWLPNWRRHQAKAGAVRALGRGSRLRIPRRRASPMLKEQAEQVQVQEG